MAANQLSIVFYSISLMHAHIDANSDLAKWETDFGNKANNTKGKFLVQYQNNSRFKVLLKDGDQLHWRNDEGIKLAHR